MDWLVAIAELVGIVVQIGVLGTQGYSGPVRVPGVSRRDQGRDDAPFDADALARYVSRTSTRSTPLEGAFLLTPTGRDPMWDRELDG